MVLLGRKLIGSMPGTQSELTGIASVLDTPSVSLLMAVGTKPTNVVQTVVLTVAINMVQMQSKWFALPLADAALTALVIAALLEVHANYTGSSLTIEDFLLTMPVALALVAAELAGGLGGIVSELLAAVGTIAFH